MSGLNKNQVKDYWVKRSSKQGGLTVGFSGNTTMQAQDEEYNQKIEFVKPFLDPNLRTIDYGCGIGRWAKLFNNYLGVDITPSLLDIAKENNPDKEFLQLSKPYFTQDAIAKIKPWDFQQFFTSTVLQHCDDELVSDIFKSLSKIKKENFVCVLYETSIKNGAYHNKGRDIYEYIRLMSPYFQYKGGRWETHNVHGADHSVYKIFV